MLDRGFFKLGGGTIRASIVSGLLATALAAPVAAQDAGGEKAAPVKLQLNKLDPAGDSCRATMVVDNSRGGALKTYKVDLFAFDTDGVVQKRVTVELGPIAARKTIVKVFDFQGLACPKIGRVLLNDILSCDGGENCLDRTEIDSKVAIPFDR